MQWIHVAPTEGNSRAELKEEGLRLLRQDLVAIKGYDDDPLSVWDVRITDDALEAHINIEYQAYTPARLMIFCILVWTALHAAFLLRGHYDAAAHGVWSLVSLGIILVLGLIGRTLFRRKLRQIQRASIERFEKE